MYLGRIISAGKTEDGKPYVAYRVSSRSFPNRQVKVLEDEAAIIPKEGFETDIFKNSYIAYDCVKVLDDIAVISNGSQTNPIADKIAIGMNIRDAMAYSLITMDYEKDDYNTPRIAAVVKGSADSYEAYIGIVTDSKVLVEKIEDGKAQFISTYEKTLLKMLFSLQKLLMLHVSSFLMKVHLLNLKILFLQLQQYLMENGK